MNFYLTTACFYSSCRFVPFLFRNYVTLYNITFTSSVIHNGIFK